MYRYYVHILYILEFCYNIKKTGDFTKEILLYILVTFWYVFFNQLLLDYLYRTRIYTIYLVCRLQAVWLDFIYNRNLITTQLTFGENEIGLNLLIEQEYICLQTAETKIKSIYFLLILIFKPIKITYKAKNPKTIE